MTCHEWREGYKQGFEDGYEKAKRDAKDTYQPNPFYSWTTTYTQPTSYDGCSVCGMKLDKPMTHICWRDNCPRKATS